MKTASRYLLIAVFMGSLTALAGAGASADELPQRTVHFADLDLTQSAGVAQLYERIKVDIRELASIAAANQCMAQALARGIAKVDALALTNYYLARTGKSMSIARQ